MIINVNQHYFHIIENHKDAFNQEMFEGRYSEILDRYPYIVGDIGFEQLRLKGFFDDKKKGADISKRFSAIQDYLLEYCNFGCAYFVLKRLTESEVVKLTQPELITDIESNEHDDLTEVIVQEEIEDSVVDEVADDSKPTADNEIADESHHALKEKNMKTFSNFIK